MDYEPQNATYLMGYIVGDPIANKTKTTETPVTSFSVSVSRGYRNKETGLFVTDLFRCVAWRDLAEWCHENLAKGDYVGIKGKLRNSQWDSKETGERRQATEIRLSEVRILRKKNFITKQMIQGDEDSKMTEESEIPDDIETADVTLDDIG